MAPAPPKLPGVATSDSPYPQYGISGSNTVGSSAGLSVVEAKNAAQKASYTASGVIVWFTSKNAAQAEINSQSSIFNGQIPGSNWLTGLGGLIASGLESGFVSFLNDLWSGIVGYVEITVGAILLGAVLVFAFRNDIMQLAPLAMALAG